MKFISQKKEAGFTLIEVMTVVTIIGILMAIALTTLYEARKEARDRSRGAELEQLKLSLKLYKEATSTNAYPSYPNGTMVTAGGALATALEEFVAGEAHHDPLDTGDFRYWYDSDFDCNGASYTVVGAQSLEVEGNSNFAKVCSSSGGGSTTEIPLSDANNSYIVLIRKN